MLIITNFIVFTNNRLYIGKSRGPFPDQVEDRLVSERIPLWFYKIRSIYKEIKEIGSFIHYKGR